MTGIDPAVFRRAADVIRERGLAYGQFVDDAGGHCTVGALRAANGAHWTQLVPELRLLADLIGTPAQPAHEDRTLGFTEVTRWNDALQRTPAEVIALLEQAAEKVEADL